MKAHDQYQSTHFSRTGLSFRGFDSTHLETHYSKGLIYNDNFFSPLPFFQFLQQTSRLSSSHFGQTVSCATDPPLAFELLGEHFFFLCFFLWPLFRSTLLRLFFSSTTFLMSQDGFQTSPTFLRVQ